MRKFKGNIIKDDIITHFSFDIRSKIEAIKDFDSSHYAPLLKDDWKQYKRGTIAYDDYWDIHDERCLNGYAPIVNGIEYPRITGVHYFYLNIMNIMLLKEGKKNKELDHPFYRLLDHLMFLEIEYLRSIGKGMIIGKPRRMGMSYIASALIIHNLLFHINATTAIGAGIEDKATGLHDKVHKGLQSLIDPYRVSFKKTKNDTKLKYEFMEDKIKQEEGIGSILDVRTFNKNASALEGGSYNIVVFEEIGIYPSANLLLSYKNTEPCFMEGGIMFGFPLLFGTAGILDKGSKDYMDMYKDPDSYNLKKIFVPAYMYYPGFKEDDGTETPNYFNIRTGLTNEVEALKDIMKRRIRTKGNMDAYIKEVQQRPYKEEELFIKTNGGVLDRIALNGQLQRIMSDDVPLTFVRGRYEWVDNDETKYFLARCRNTKEKTKVRVKYKSKVVFIEDPTGTVWHLKGFKKINNSNLPYNPDIGASDSYDDEHVTNGSFGATIGYRVFNGMSSEYDLPISLVYERGDGTSDDTFFENSVMMGIFWNMEILVEYTKTAIITYFKDVGAEMWLRRNPEISSDIVINNARQEYGVKMTAGKRGFKSLVTKLLKLEIKENVHKIYLDKILIDLIDYGDGNTDISMAYGIVLIHKLDIFDYISEDIDEPAENDILSDIDFYDISNTGRLLVKREYEEIKIDSFDPRKHLTGEEQKEYIKYLEKKKKVKEKNEERIKKINQTRQEDVFLQSITEEIKRKQKINQDE